MITADVRAYAGALSASAPDKVGVTFALGRIASASTLAMASLSAALSAGNWIAERRSLIAGIKRGSTAMRSCRALQGIGRARLMKCLAVCLITALFAACQLVLCGICHAQAESVSQPELNNALIEYVIGDKRRALELLTPLAKAGSSTAQLVLWRLYADVLHDCRSGLPWLERSAQAGNVEASYELGERYLRGDCVEANASTALGLFIAADNKDYPGAASHIGEIYLKTAAAGGDYEAAFQWFMRGATLYDMDACFHLGELYVNGWGVVRDDFEALKWFDLSARLAANSSDELTRALAARDRVRERLTPLQVSRVMAQAQSLWDGLVNHTADIENDPHKMQSVARDLSSP